jgi:hypothetical protein
MADDSKIFLSPAKDAQILETGTQGQVLEVNRMIQDLGHNILKMTDTTHQVCCVHELNCAHLAYLYTSSREFQRNESD